MKFGWFTLRKRARSRRRAPNTKHYEAHKELARSLILSRLLELNAQYGHAYGRVAIRNQVSRWGSCSKRQNLNFNYRLIFLPAHLMDYVIVHELCHLKHFNHGKEFWSLVAQGIPNYKEYMEELHVLAQKIYHPDTVLPTLHA